MGGLRRKPGSLCVPIRSVVARNLQRLPLASWKTGMNSGEGQPESGTRVSPLNDGLHGQECSLQATRIRSLKAELDHTPVQTRTHLAS